MNNAYLIEFSCFITLHFSDISMFDLISFKLLNLKMCKKEMCWKHELFELIITIVQTHKSGIAQTPIFLNPTCA